MFDYMTVKEAAKPADKRRKEIAIDDKSVDC